MKIYEHSMSTKYEFIQIFFNIQQRPVLKSFYTIHKKQEKIRVFWKKYCLYIIIIINIAKSTRADN